MRKNANRLALSKWMFLILLLLVPGIWSLSGNREGNGGDHIRSTFIKMGKSVIHFLRTSDQGLALSEKHHLNLDTLEAGLDIEKISVIEGSLIDNGGSVVEATGEPGKITLLKDSWYEHFERERDVYYLVFHELLRQAAINDDNYVISAGIRPFPTSDRITTRIATVLPLISTDNIIPFLPTSASELALNGSGCHPEDVLLDLNTEEGILDLSFEIFQAKGMGDRAACEVRLPVKMNPVRKLIISQIDLSGRMRLPQGSSVSISLRPNLGASVGSLIKKVVTTEEVGRFKLRTNPNFATSCEDRPSILGLNSNVQLLGSTPAAIVNVDRLSIYFKTESCTPGSDLDKKR